MTQPEDPKDSQRARYVFNMTLAAVAGQVGFLTLFIVLVALFGGLWLDKQFDTKPLITIILVLASVPVTLVMMFWIVRNATARMTTNLPSKTSSNQETKDSGTKTS